MADYEAFNERVWWAYAQMQARVRRKVDQKELGQLVGQELGREPYSPSTAGRWLTEALPDVPVVWALARVLNVDAGWLAFGACSTAQAPPGWAWTRPSVASTGADDGLPPLDEATAQSVAEEAAAMDRGERSADAPPASERRLDERRRGPSR